MHFSPFQNGPEVLSPWESPPSDEFRFENLVAFLALSPLPAVRSCQADERDVSPQPWGLRGARVQGPGIFVSLCLPFLLTGSGGKGEGQRATLWDCRGATHSGRELEEEGKETGLRWPPGKFQEVAKP